MARILVLARVLPACGLAVLAFLATAARAAQAPVVQCGLASLQNAIDSAPSGATLVVRGTCVGTFQIQGKSLTIQAGPGGATLAAPGTGTNPTLLVSASGQTVSLAGLKITGGTGRPGEASV